MLGRIPLQLAVNNEHQEVRVEGEGEVLSCWSVAPRGENSRVTM